MKRRNWIDTDLDGLAKILERRGGKYFALYELIQNCWDEDGVRFVEVILRRGEKRGTVNIDVIDDSPNGFAVLSHAFTMFAESLKKKDPTKAGRFNLGEKLVLAICVEASITTTTGQVIFSEDGTRRQTKRSRDVGSIFQGVVKMTQKEMDETIEKLRLLIAPRGIQTHINGEIIPEREPVVSFDATLLTDVADAEGNLRRSTRKTIVEVFDAGEDETPALYELGIPVVETNDRFHINVKQKVPLNMDRDNVPPAFLQAVRTFTFNRVFNLLDKEDATSAWVELSTSDERCHPDGVRRVMDLRFGKKRVSFDPSDPEGTKKAMSKEYTVIHGGSLTGGQWRNVKAAGAVLPAGKVTPSDKPYTPGGNPLTEIPMDKWTENMKKVADLFKRLAPPLLDEKHIFVVIANDPALKAVATYGPNGVLVLNRFRLGKRFFDEFNMESSLDLLIHELGHEYSGDHLSAHYYNALTQIGARLSLLALKEPDLFKVNS